MTAAAQKTAEMNKSKRRVLYPIGEPHTLDVKAALYVVIERAKKEEEKKYVWMQQKRRNKQRQSWYDRRARLLKTKSKLIKKIHCLDLHSLIYIFPWLYLIQILFQRVITYLISTYEIAWQKYCHAVNIVTLKRTSVGGA
jgi:hypothetical protein